MNDLRIASSQLAKSLAFPSLAAVAAVAMPLLVGDGGPPHAGQADGREQAQAASPPAVLVPVSATLAAGSRPLRAAMVRLSLRFKGTPDRAPRPV